MAFCFVYVALILVLPYEMPPITVLLIGFGIGIIIDIFGDTLGMHAASTVFMAFLRPTILKQLTPRNGYGQNFSFSIHETGLLWFLAYAGLLIFSHHLVLFLIDAAHYKLFGQALLKTFTSSALTLLMVVIGMYLFSGGEKR